MVAFSAFVSESGSGGEKQSFSVKDYDAMKNCATDRSKKPTSIDNCGISFQKNDEESCQSFLLWD